MRRAGEADVVDIVPGRLRQRAFLSPPGYAPKDEPWIARQARFGAESQPLHDTGPEAFDQRLRLIQQTPHGLQSLGMLEVDGKRAAAAFHHRMARRQRNAQVGRLQTVDAQNLRAHIGEQHRTHGRRPDAAEFNDLHPVKRSH